MTWSLHLHPKDPHTHSACFLTREAGLGVSVLAHGRCRSSLGLERQANGRTGVSGPSLLRPGPQQGLPDHPASYPAPSVPALSCPWAAREMHPPPRHLCPCPWRGLSKPGGNGSWRQCLFSSMEDLQGGHCASFRMKRCFFSKPVTETEGGLYRVSAQKRGGFQVA